MRSGYRYICLCAAFLINALCIRAGTANDSLWLAAVERQADSLYGSRQYYDASLSYEKAIYYHRNPVKKAALALKRTEALRQIGSFDIAEQTLKRVDLAALNDSMFYLVKYNAALCAYLNSDFASAESHLLQLVSFAKDTIRLAGSYPLYTLVLNELGKYDDAKHYLERFVSVNRLEKDSLTPMIEKEYEPAKRPKYKRLKKAKIMSYIVPGLGQMYAGFYGEGITAMACNAIFLGLTGVGIYYKYYLTSILYSYTIFSKFYTGNISRMEFLVNKRNYLLQKNYNQRLKQLVMACWK